VCVHNKSNGAVNLTFLTTFEEVMEESQRSKTIKWRCTKIKWNMGAT